MYTFSEVLHLSQKKLFADNLHEFPITVNILICLLNIKYLSELRKRDCLRINLIFEQENTAHSYL
ncbi:hypothetical protein DXC26_13545 [Clostridiaceae bacterium OM08-6BH]|nr:hypothetical protein DXC26_13545 [Clostridiaceae bacterium OM08-6BH]